MKIMETEYFVIKYQDNLEDFVKISLNYFDARLYILRELFNKDIKNLDKMECSFFSDIKDFQNYIKKISGQTPPDWAGGCFYNNGIQIIVNTNDKEKLIKRQITLIHEFTHLCIKNLIYDAFNIERIRWLDESYAGYVDGHLEKLSAEEIKNYCEELKTISNNFDMNELDDISLIKTKEYDGYHMFDIIGKYIFENNLQKQYLQILKNDEKQIRTIGKSILKNAIVYVDALGRSPASRLG